jgi:phosphomannomutase/phosphoglucomutase
LGRAVGSAARNAEVVVGGDFRISTPALMSSVKQGLVDSGALVYDLGQVSTPYYYFARRRLGIRMGVMVTASHSPPGYNGFKPILGDRPITPEDLESLKQQVISERFSAGSGSVKEVGLRRDYVEWLSSRFAGLAQMAPKVVFDCGNGATGWIIHDVLKALSMDGHVMFPEPDGTFPNRTPDISGPQDLSLLQEEVRKVGARLGAGFDGDGDRVGFVDESGRRIPSDTLIAWLARELLKQDPGGKVIYDIKLSKVVPETVEKSNGTPIVQRSGHTFIKTAMLEFGAVLGGEYTGHLFYRELEGGDDGLFSALLVSTLVAEQEEPLSQLLSDLPRYCSTPDLRIRYAGEKVGLIRKAIDHSTQQGARLVLIDGVKAEYDDGWALMRASVTEPAFTFRFEGSTTEDMLNVAGRFLSGLGPLGDEVLSKVR